MLVADKGEIGDEAGVGALKRFRVRLAAIAAGPQATNGTKAAHTATRANAIPATVT